MFKFLKNLKANTGILILLVILVIFQVSFDFLIPYELKSIIDVLRATPAPKDMSNLWPHIVLMVTFACGSGLSAIGVGKLSSFLTARMMSSVRYQLFSKISLFSIDEMNKFSTSSLITRTTNDITNISNTYSYLFRYILYGPLVGIGSIIVLITLKNWQMILLTTGSVALLMGMLILIIKIAVPKFREIQDKVDKVNLLTKENLEGLRVVRAYNAESYQEEKFEIINEDLRKTDAFANIGVNSFIPGIQLIIGLLSVGIAWIGSYLIHDRTMEFSEMTLVSEYSILLLIGFILMTYIFIQIPRSIVCAKRIHEVLNTDVRVKDGENNNGQTEVGTIEFKNVSFAYPGAELPVLHNISFKVNKGETIAFIGATGSGKTTLINLMPRFADVTEGEVLIDGLNVKDYKLDDLFAKFGYVPQKPYLFHKTLKENVCLGKPNASDEEFERALEISQSLEFVNKLPKRENYEISQGGKNVSGGQRQRLSIARAILLRPEIFIFDDSFSALDYRTDKILRGEIKDKCKGATSVIVAQRVGTIIDADQIIVLDNGEMVGHGTHKELIKNCSVYKEIAESQLGKEGLKQ